MEISMLSVYDHARKTAVYRGFFKTEDQAHEAAKHMAIEYAMYDDNGATQREEPRKVTVVHGLGFDLRGENEPCSNYYRYSIRVRMYCVNDNYHKNTEEDFAKEGKCRLDQFKELKNSIELTNEELA